MDLNRISTFVRVVETGTFTAAAAALGLPKSSVSRGVAQLEEALGVRLLQRTTRKLNLTDAGRSYFQRVRAAMSGLEQANSAAADTEHEPRGIVRVTAPGDFGNGLLSAVIADFLLLHPRIHVDVTLTGRWVNLVEEGFDLAVRAGKLRDSSLVARKIAVTDMGLYAAPTYLERRGRPRRLGELANHECLLHRSGKGIMPWRLTGPRGPELVSVSGPVTT
ncbi:MAG: LysR family transcriptional regulator, partial [Deltaproteobacteria bacterium]|nr:LysR family transcriptional regulator [Deltaproteobacteria bacterium]